jgi:hypothetical protein
MIHALGGILEKERTVHKASKEYKTSTLNGILSGCIEKSQKNLVQKLRDLRSEECCSVTKRFDRFEFPQSNEDICQACSGCYKDA